MLFSTFLVLATSAWVAFADGPFNIFISSAFGGVNKNPINYLGGPSRPVTITGNVPLTDDTLWFVKTTQNKIFKFCSLTNPVQCLSIANNTLWFSPNTNDATSFNVVHYKAGYFLQVDGETTVSGSIFHLSYLSPSNYQVNVPYPGYTFNSNDQLANLRIRTFTKPAGTLVP